MEVRQTYRALWRAANSVFKGDCEALSAARVRIRSEYSKAAPASAKEMSEKLKMARDVAQILRANVIQGKRDNVTGRFRLNFRKDVEMGDNNSRFKAQPFRK